MKRFYNEPEITVVSIAVEDVITASGGIDGYGPDTDNHYEFGERTR